MGCSLTSKPQGPCPSMQGQSPTPGAGVRPKKVLSMVPVTPHPTFHTNKPCPRGKGRKHHTGLQNQGSPPPPLCHTAQGSSLACPPSLRSGVRPAGQHCPSWRHTAHLNWWEGNCTPCTHGQVTASEQVWNQKRVHLTNHIIKY